MKFVICTSDVCMGGPVVRIAFPSVSGEGGMQSAFLSFSDVRDLSGFGLSQSKTDLQNCPSTFGVDGQSAAPSCAIESSIGANKTPETYERTLDQ